MATESDDLEAEVAQLKLDLEEERQRTDDLREAIAARDRWAEAVQTLSKQLATARRRLKEAGWNVALYLGRRRRRPGQEGGAGVRESDLQGVGSVPGDVGGALGLDGDANAARPELPSGGRARPAGGPGRPASHRKGRRKKSGRAEESAT